VRKHTIVACLIPILAIAACSSGLETPADCIDRFSDDAELIDFMNNDVYGATYTYEFDEFGAFNEAFQRDNLEEGEPAAQFRIAGGKAYMTVDRAVPLEESAVAFGCSSAPENSKLVTIQRERLQRENEDK